MFYVVGVRHPVENMVLATQFFSQDLGFYPVKKEGYHSWLENGSMCITLEEGEPQHLMLELQCPDVEIEYQRLIKKHPNIRTLQAVQQVDTRIDCRVACPHGLTLILAKTLNEDDLNLLLPLPSTLVWDEAVDLRTRRILRSVPLGFRDSARKRVTERAEYAAVEKGLLAVGEAEAMHSMVAITPAFQHRALMENMQDEGINSDLYLDASKIEM